MHIFLIWMIIGCQIIHCSMYSIEPSRPFILQLPKLETLIKGVGCGSICGDASEVRHEGSDLQHPTNNIKQI